MNFSSIHNYYEQLVVEYLTQEIIDTLEDQSEDFILDVACYALTKLPSRYVRHEVDMVFFLSSDERLEMISQARKAVDESLEYISRNFNRNHRYE